MQKFLETLCLVSLGSFIAVANFLVILAAIRNKNLRENTRHNLVIFLSVCDFVEGLILILYGSVFARDNEADQKAIDILCTVYYCVACVTYNTPLQHKS